MILGIKVGLQTESISDLIETNTPFCEVWFNILQKDSYNSLFTEIKNRSITCGLHFWGHTTNNIWANIAYPDKEIITASMQMMKDTIDIAAQHSFVYVNIHPSNFALVTINFSTQQFTLQSKPADPNLCESLFFENATILRDYATERNVQLTLETIPCKDTNGWHGNTPRLTPLDLYAPTNSLIVKAATEGFTIANDFAHTSSSIADPNRSVIQQHLFTMTQTLAPQTKLLHLGYIIPPYNGTDYHDHLDNPLFKTSQAVPNEVEMIELLRLFKDRGDVYALAEPDGRHRENYAYAKALLEAI